MKPGRLLEKMRAEKLRADDREKLAALRGKLKSARARRRKAMQAAARVCRQARKAVAARVLAYRKSERERIAAESRALRDRARSRCTRRKCVIQKAGGGLVARERAMLREERALQAQLRRLAQHAKTRVAKHATKAKERKAESDDFVRGNLPRELVPVFNRVRASIKGGPRTTRTEAFLEWAESHPDEVLEHQGHDTDREVARLVAEHEQLAGRLRKGKRHYSALALAEAVPF